MVVVVVVVAAAAAAAVVVVLLVVAVAVIAQSVYRLGYGLDSRGSRVRFPAGD
jgi:hypothetical protein